MYRNKLLATLLVFQISAIAKANDLEKFIKFAANHASMGTYMADLEREKQAIKNKYDLQLAQAMQQISKDADAQMREILKMQVEDYAARGEKLQRDKAALEELLQLDISIKDDLGFLLKNQAKLLEKNSEVIANFSASQQFILQQTELGSVDLSKCTDNLCIRFSVLNDRFKSLTSTNQNMVESDKVLRNYLIISIENVAGVKGMLAMTDLDIQQNNVIIETLNNQIKALN